MKRFPSSMFTLRAWIGAVGIIAAASVCCCDHAAAAAWRETRWHDESAMVAENAGWSAIVSLDRARLVHFGPTDTGENLLFAPPTRQDPNGWGGHRVWLGPQAEWPAVWPPDASWEASAAESVRNDGGVLTLVMPDSHHGWARITRTYSWDGDGLSCGVRLNGGQHAGQVIQIMQVHAAAQVRVQARPDASTPAGFVVLQIGRKEQVQRSFPSPAGVTRESSDMLRLQPAGSVEKLAFVPQPLRASLRGCELVLEATRETGSAVGAVDDGFVTQVYLGRAEVPFLELEQLSSRFAAGQDASATIVLRARRL